jgi:hypothetical protein
MNLCWERDLIMVRIGRRSGIKYYRNKLLLSCKSFLKDGVLMLLILLIDFYSGNPKIE